VTAVDENALRRLTGQQLTDLYSTAGTGLRADIDEERGRRMNAPSEAAIGRSIIATTATHIAVKPVYWLWEGRVPRGEITLIAGREGTGKSTTAFDLAASVSNGRLPGEHYGTPRNVAICATEDSLSHTVVPRLIAAGADLSRVRLLTMSEGILTLPDDLFALREVVEQTETVLLILDPLLSRINAKADTHKYADTLLALEPLKAFCEETGVSCIGLVHFSKQTTVDALTSIMGSRAFTTVPRSVLTVERDSEDAGRYYLAHAKCNLAPLASTLAYEIEGRLIAEQFDGKQVWSSKVRWAGEDARSADDLHAPDTEVATAVGEAAGWLEDFMTLHPDGIESSLVKEAGRKAGHSADALKRARKRLSLKVRDAGVFPRKTLWVAVGTSQNPASTAPTAPTAPF
jgi:RecA/RadA recombinase